MKFTGEIQSITKDWNTDKFIVSLTMNESLPIDEVNSLMGEKLSIEIKKWRKKRSLDANAYLWVLCTAIAEKRECSKEEVYEEMLQHYGCFYQDENGDYIVITLRADIDTSKIDGHWKFFKQSEDGRFKSYLMIKGSSQYDSCEMAKFLDLVIQDAKQEGIETATPNEIERMKALWGKHYENSITK